MSDKNGAPKLVPPAGKKKIPAGGLQELQQLGNTASKAHAAARVAHAEAQLAAARVGEKVAALLEAAKADPMSTIEDDGTITPPTFEEKKAALDAARRAAQGR